NGDPALGGRAAVAYRWAAGAGGVQPGAGRRAAGAGAAVFGHRRRPVTLAKPLRALFAAGLAERLRMGAVRNDPAGRPGDRLRAGLARLSTIAGRRSVDQVMRNIMSRLLLTILLALALPVAAEVRELQWSDLIPPGAPPPPPPLAIHDLSQLADALA